MSVDPEASPRIRDEAATRLARLADATDRDGRPLVLAARPSTGGVCVHSLERTDPSCQRRSRSGFPAVSWPACLPARGSGSWPARLMASRCAATAASFGSVVHVLADHGARTGAELDELTEPSGVGVAPAELRRATGCPRSSGWRRSRRWSGS